MECAKVSIRFQARISWINYILAGNDQIEELKKNSCEDLDEVRTLQYPDECLITAVY